MNANAEDTLYLSGQDRLAQLPQVFTANEAPALLGVAPAMARVYLQRWRNREKPLISSLGDRACVYINHVAPGPLPKERLFAEALKLIIDNPLVIGPMVLIHHGLITQIPNTIHLAVQPKRTFPEIDGVEFLKRREEWVKLAGRYIDPRLKISGLPTVKPVFALADAIAHGVCGDVWRPYPDDIDLPETVYWMDEFRRLVKKMTGVSLDSRAEDFETLYEEAYERITPKPPMRSMQWMRKRLAQQSEKLSCEPVLG